MVPLNKDRDPFFFAMHGPINTTRTFRRNARGWRGPWRSSATPARGATQRLRCISHVGDDGDGVAITGRWRGGILKMRTYSRATSSALNATFHTSSKPSAHRTDDLTSVVLR
jgi:hypothetical protein